MTRQERRYPLPRLTVTASLLAVGLSPLLLSGSAQAVAAPATVSFSGQHLNYLAADGQTNHLTVTKSEEPADDPSGGYGAAKLTYTLDDAVTITADSDRCTYPTSSDQTLVVCTWIVEEGQDPASIATFMLTDKNDTVTFVNPSEDTYNADEFDLGSGNDTYTSTKYLDGSTIVGGVGNDTITVDRLGGDLSRLVGNNGSDTLRVKDGDFAFLDGGIGNDTLYGGTGEQFLSGGDGNDLIHAGVGPDSITGGKGNDTLYGEHGDDTIYGNSGNDKLYGGQGKDTLSGGPGKDVIKQD
jgi:serralysin